MSDIRYTFPYLKEPEKRICEILIEFYEEMKQLEKDIEKCGKQGTLIVMTVNDLKLILNKNS